MNMQMPLSMMNERCTIHVEKGRNAYGERITEEFKDVRCFVSAERKRHTDDNGNTFFTESTFFLPKKYHEKITVDSLLYHDNKTYKVKTVKSLRTTRGIHHIEVDC